jgi:hypothetical protein
VQSDLNKLVSCCFVIILTDEWNANVLFMSAVTERDEEKSNFLLGGELAFLFFCLIRFTQ